MGIKQVQSALSVLSFSACLAENPESRILFTSFENDRRVEAAGMQMRLNISLKAICSAIVLCVIACGSAVAQYQPIPNYTGVGAGQRFRNDINNHLSGVTPIAPRIVSLPFAQLPSEQDGQEYWCLDCMRSNPCAGGGAGALAVGQRGAWSCTSGGSVNGVFNVTEYGANSLGTADASAGAQA